MFRLGAFSCVVIVVANCLCNTRLPPWVLQSTARSCRQGREPCRWALSGPLCRLQPVPPYSRHGGCCSCATQLVAVVFAVGQGPLNMPIVGRIRPIFPSLLPASQFTAPSLHFRLPHKRSAFPPRARTATGHIAIDSTAEIAFLTLLISSLLAPSQDPTSCPSSRVPCYSRSDGGDCCHAPKSHHHRRFQGPGPGEEDLHLHVGSVCCPGAQEGPLGPEIAGYGRNLGCFVC